MINRYIIVHTLNSVDVLIQNKIILNKVDKLLQMCLKMIKVQSDNDCYFLIKFCKTKI